MFSTMHDCYIQRRLYYILCMNNIVYYAAIRSTYNNVQWNYLPNTMSCASRY